MTREDLPCRVCGGADDVRGVPPRGWCVFPEDFGGALCRACREERVRADRADKTTAEVPR